MSTSYIVQEVHADGTVKEIETRSRKDPAVDLAASHHLEQEGKVEVQVVTDTGTVVHSIPAVEVDVPEEVADDAEVEQAVAEAEVEVLKEADAPAETVEEAEKRTRPWSKVDKAKTFEVPEIPGYTHAYTRERIKTAIYRADDKSDWLVFDTRELAEDKDYAGEHFANTTEARLRTNEMHDEYRKQVDAAKTAAKVAKDEAKAAAKAAKEKADKEKADEKAAAKAAKDAAAAAKETETEDADESETADA